MLMLEMFLMNVESLMSGLQKLWSEVKIFLLSGETLPVMLVSKVGCLWVTDYGNLYLGIILLCFFSSLYFDLVSSHGEISVVTMVVDNGLSWFIIALIVTIMTMMFSGQNWSLSILGAAFPQLDKVWTWTGKGLCPCKTPQRAGLKSHNSWDYHWLSSSLSLLLSLL